jgi:putative ATPase
MLGKSFRLARLATSGEAFPMAEGADQSEIFGDHGDRSASSRPAPLAARLRPRSLDEVVGQQHVVGEGGLLPRLIRSDDFGSLLFYGPPGCGKTSLAEVIAAETRSRFVRVNAVLSNVAEMREILRMARYREAETTIVFVDEIHRFNKAQQDLLLPDVESGSIRLIGATTHNPGFYINAPLLSRSHLFRLEPIATELIEARLALALEDSERGLGAGRWKAEPEVLRWLAVFAEGDLRRGLNALETLARAQAVGACIGMDALKAFAEERQLRYDRDEDAHYDHASALIKSVRGSDPDAALYWLFKMLAGGEDPRFLARRLVIAASEDIGLANSHALVIATAAFEACEKVGLPECEYALAHATLYLATSPKSNSVTRAMAAVKQHLREQPAQPVPLHLRDAHNATNTAFGNGADYLYSHDFPRGISGQDYMADPVTFFTPGSEGAEAATAQRMAELKKLKSKVRKERGETEG